jgi:hypothetical protein
MPMGDAEACKTFLVSTVLRGEIEREGERRREVFSKGTKEAGSLES